MCFVMETYNFNEFNTQKRLDTEESDDKDEKVMYKLTSHAVHGQTLENLTKRINASKQ